MRTILIANAKGGVGKTTLTAALATRAAKDKSVHVYVVDIDPQHSLAYWLAMRPVQSRPDVLTGVDRLSEAVENLNQSGLACDYLFCDSPSTLYPLIEAAVGASDLVVIPMRASPIDMRALPEMLASCNAAKKPVLIVLTFVESDAASKKITAEVRASIERDGYAVAKTEVSRHKAYNEALADGSALAAAKDDVLTAEMDALWKEIKSTLTKRAAALAAPAPKKSARVKGGRTHGK